MERYRAGDVAEGQVRTDDVPAQQPAERTRRDAQPWYELAREAAQIIASGLALYASVKAFANKMKQRREA
jgi:hypothetical protein